MDLSIKGKFTAASLALLVLVSGLVIFLLSVQSRLENQMNTFIQKNLAAINKAEQIKYHIVLYDGLLYRHMATGDQFSLMEAVAALEEAEKWIAQTRDIAEDGSEKEILGEIEKEAARYRSDARRLLSDYQSAENAVNISKASAAGKNRLVRIYSQCEKMVDIYRGKMETAQNQMKARIKNIRRTVYGIGLFSYMVALVIVILLMHQILSPIQDLLAGVQKVASGNLDLQLPVSSSDEIGSLTEHFNSMTRSLKENHVRLLTETITDPLTGLHNLRYFQDRLQSEILRAQRYHHSFCLIIVDIDHFKNFNDKNGHQKGNILLKEIAGIIRKSVRSEGVTARYGGEEFALILPETGTDGGKVVAERIRKAIETADFPGQDTQPRGRLTVSVGGAAFPQGGSTAVSLFEKADQALYKAKNTGRNRVHWA